MAASAAPGVRLLFGRFLGIYALLRIAFHRYDLSIDLVLELQHLQSTTLPYVAMCYQNQVPFDAQARHSDIVATVFSEQPQFVVLDYCGCGSEYDE